MSNRMTVQVEMHFDSGSESATYVVGSHLTKRIDGMWCVFVIGEDFPTTAFNMGDNLDLDRALFWMAGEKERMERKGV